MAKGNDKKVVRQARETLLAAIGNLLESHRERRFTRSSGTPLTRSEFCDAKTLPRSNVAHIETGRFLSLDVAHLRTYLATTHGLNNPAFNASTKKVYDGLKELENLLKAL